jgi:hypothetical protein
VLSSLAVLITNRDKIHPFVAVWATLFFLWALIDPPSRKSSTIISKLEVILASTVVSTVQQLTNQILIVQSKYQELCLYWLTVSTIVWHFSLALMSKMQRIKAGICLLLEWKWEMIKNWNKSPLTQSALIFFMLVISFLWKELWIISLPASALISHNPQLVDQFAKENVFAEDNASVQIFALHQIPAVQQVMLLWMEHVLVALSIKKSALLLPQTFAKQLLAIQRQELVLLNPQFVPLQILVYQQLANLL